MPKYYNTKKSTLRVVLANGREVGLPGRREVEIDRSLISVELQQLIDQGVVRYRGGGGMTMTIAEDDSIIPVEVVEPMATSTSIQYDHDIVCQPENSVVSLQSISEDILDSVINDDGGIDTDSKPVADD